MTREMGPSMDIGQSVPRHVAGKKETFYRFLLFVAADEPNSRLAQENLQRLSETVLAGRCEVEVIDVFENIDAALAHGILITPAVRIVQPAIDAVVVGNLRDASKLLAVLGIPEE